MSELLSQIVLPISLALMMFAMGLSLTLADFRRVVKFPKAFVLGLSLQLLLLPLLAWLLIWAVGLVVTVPLLLASGLIILAACPGGATSNIISHLSGGDGALSISMTAVVSLLAPFILPLLLTWQLGLLELWVADPHSTASTQTLTLQLPILKTLMQLMVVTVVPVLLAMLVRHHFQVWVAKHESFIRRSSTWLFLALILGLLLTNANKLMAMGWLVAFMCLSLCLLTMLLAFVLSRVVGVDKRTQTTLMIESGIQNAGTGMFIAAVLLQNPTLALIPLIYGLLMNLPAVVMIMQGRKAGYTMGDKLV